MTRSAPCAGQLGDGLAGRGQVGLFVLPGVELCQTDLHQRLQGQKRAPSRRTAPVVEPGPGSQSFSRYSSAMWRSSSAFSLQRSAMFSSRSRMDLSWWKALKSMSMSNMLRYMEA